MTVGDKTAIIDIMIDRIPEYLSDHLNENYVGTSAWEAVAAILVPLYLHNGELGATFIRRSATVKIHRCQMGFPGGMAEDRDQDDLLRTALRETEEELGVHPEDVRILGQLNPRNTVVSKILVTPFVGSISYPYPFSPDPIEVHSVHSTSIKNLLKSQEEAEDSFDLPSPVDRLDDQPVWGLTAGVLKDLVAAIRPLMDL